LPSRKRTKEAGGGRKEKDKPFFDIETVLLREKVKTTISCKRKKREDLLHNCAKKKKQGL